MAGVITNVKLKYDCNTVTLSRVLSATLHLVARMLGLPLLQNLMSHYVPLWDLTLLSFFSAKSYKGRIRFFIRDFNVKVSFPPGSCRMQQNARSGFLPQFVPFRRFPAIHGQGIEYHIPEPLSAPH